MTTRVSQYGANLMLCGENWTLPSICCLALGCGSLFRMTLTVTKGTLQSLNSGRLKVGDSYASARWPGQGKSWQCIFWKPSSGLWFVTYVQLHLIEGPSGQELFLLHSLLCLQSSWPQCWLLVDHLKLLVKWMHRYTCARLMLPARSGIIVPIFLGTILNILNNADPLSLFSFADNGRWGWLHLSFHKLQGIETGSQKE